MRLYERTLADAWIAPRMCETGEMGGLAERFSEERIHVRGSKLPEEGGLTVQERGAILKDKIRLLVPSDTPAAAGDGVWTEERMWRILSVRRWMAHLELECEAV